MKRKILVLIYYGKKKTEIHPTAFEYEIGETIRLNSEDIFKCISIEETEDTIKFIFKEGIVTFDW